MSAIHSCGRSTARTPAARIPSARRHPASSRARSPSPASPATTRSCIGPPRGDEFSSLGRFTDRMAKLIYSMQTSLDGYVNDEQGGFGWARPDEEVHSFENDLERPVGTYLYGRRM